MKTLKFRTNINCSGCVAGVTPHLDNTAGINKWQVDTSDAQKVLTVETDNLSADEVVAVVTKAGFKAEKL